jgi:hypothetical protein
VLLQRRKWLRDELDSDSKRLGVKYTCVPSVCATDASPHCARGITACRRVSAAVPPLLHSLVFVESICTDEKVIAANIRETKLKSPDYQHEEEESAVRCERS